jgi:quinol-cytochrome oxidoreductase complex cytochrome b subunit
MKYQFLFAILIAGLIVLNSLGSVAAQTDEEDCPTCRTYNFYYVLIAAIIIFAIFFYWTNRRKAAKTPVEPNKSDEEKK